VRADLSWLDQEAERNLARVQSAASSLVPKDRAARRRLAFRSARELLLKPKRLSWLIHKVLERDCLAQLFGDPGTAKTFFALDIGLCVGTGTPWNGNAVTRGTVLYILGEGSNGIGRRMRAWEIANGISLADAPFFVSNMAAALTDEDGREELVKLVREMMEQYGPIMLIILDTVARNFGPGDENKTQDMTWFIAACDEIRELTGATILTIHHTGHGNKERARGSMAMKGALDWEYSVTKDIGAVLLECVKVKDAEAPPSMAFKLVTIDLGELDEEGEPVTSAVLRPAIFMKSAQGKSGMGKNQTRVLRILADLLAKREKELEELGMDRDRARVNRQEWASLAREEGLTGKRFSEVVTSLTRAGRARQNGDEFSLGTGEDYELKE
jgi:hypothetical protein